MTSIPVACSKLYSTTYFTSCTAHRACVKQTAVTPNRLPLMNESPSLDVWIPRRDDIQSLQRLQ